MNKFVSDTMALVLHLEKRKMPSKAKEIFTSAEIGESEVYIPSMVIAEIGYLSEKGRIETNIEAVERQIEDFPFFNEKPMDMKVLKSSFEIEDIPELHDRLIAGTARSMDAILITNDPMIEQSTYVKTIWK